MKSVGSEILTLAAVLVIPVGIVASFPFGAFGFHASDGERQPVRTAFVQMTPESERLALRKARTSWQGKGVGARRLQADIFCAELPAEEPSSVLSVRDRSRPPAPPTPVCGRTAFLPSLRAAPPHLIKPGKAADPLTFSRGELLRMD